MDPISDEPHGKPNLNRIPRLAALLNRESRVATFCCPLVRVVSAHNSRPPRSRFIATFTRNRGLQEEPPSRLVIWSARTDGHYCTNHQQCASSGEAIMAPEGKRRGGPASGKDDFDGRDFS